MSGLFARAIGTGPVRQDGGELLGSLPKGHRQRQVRHNDGHRGLPDIPAEKGETGHGIKCADSIKSSDDDLLDLELASKSVRRNVGLKIAQAGGERDMQRLTVIIPRLKSETIKIFFRIGRREVMNMGIVIAISSKSVVMLQTAMVIMCFVGTSQSSRKSRH